MFLFYKIGAFSLFELMEEKRNIKIQAKSKLELATDYGISVRTFNKWVKPFENIIGKCVGRIYTPKQVKLIYDSLGEP